MKASIHLAWAAVLAIAGLGCQRAPLQLAADTQASTPEATEVADIVAPPIETPLPDVTPEAVKAPVVVPDAVALAPDATPAVKPTVAAPPLPAAQAIGPPKTMAPPPVPFSMQSRPPQSSATEALGKRDLFKPASSAAEFTPKRLPEETMVPEVFRPVRDEPELSRNDNPRQPLPTFAVGLRARKPSIDPNAVPPLAPLSSPQLEKVLPTSDPGSLATRSVALPVAQPTRPETSPTDPRVADPEENVRAFRVQAPLPDLDPPVSAAVARPLLPVAPVTK